MNFPLKSIRKFGHRYLNPVQIIKRVMSTVILCCLVALVFSPMAFSMGDVSPQFSVSPFVGNGSTSTGKSIQNNSGLSISADLPFKTAERTHIGPRIEAINSMVNTTYASDGNLKASYDHRIFAAGIYLEKLIGARPSTADDLPISIYGTAIYGKNFSKLILDESTDTTFSQTSYSGISGDYYSGEIGFRLPVKKSFSISLGITAATTNINQNVVGQGQDEQVIDRAYLTSEVNRNAADLLPVEVTQKTLAAKAGFTLGF